MANRNDDINDNSLTTDAEPIEEISRLAISDPREKSNTSNAKDNQSGPYGSKKGPTHTEFPFSKFHQQFPNFMKQPRQPVGSFQAIQVGNVNSLHFGNNITYNCTNVNIPNTKMSGKSSKPAQETPKPKKVEIPIEILMSKKVVTEDIMLIVKHGDLGYKWKDLGQILSLSNGTLQSVEYENRDYGLNEFVYQVLIKWKEKSGKLATVGKLANALDAIERGDLALKLVDDS